MNFELPINDSVNIQDTIIQGYCKNKCKLRYNYPEINSACVSKISSDSQLENKASSPTESSPVNSTSTTNTDTNENNYLSLTFNETKPTPSVSFNGLGYNETEMRIYAPSLHLFNNKRADIEVCIYHQQVSGLPEKLLICIPFMKQTTKTSRKELSEAAKVIENLMDTAGGCGFTPKIIASAFSLNTLLPSKPYFYYKNDKQEHIVCFHTTKDNIIPSNFDITFKRPVVENNSSPYTDYELFFSGEQVSENVKDDIYLEVKKIIEDAEKESEEFTVNFTDEGFVTMNDVNSILTYSNLINYSLIGLIAYTGYKIFETKK